MIMMDQAVEISEAGQAPALLNGLPVAEIRSALDRILRSRAFIHSHRIRRFLQFVVEECLLGQQHRLKEYLIGLEVFNRLETFDPRVDSIVRVEARRLRTKLDEYYQTEGQDDEIRIELRKGSYVPIVEHRHPGMYGGYASPALVYKRHSVAIGQLTGLDGDSAELAEDLRRKLSHVLIKDGHFQVLAGFNGEAGRPADGTDGANGHSKAEPARMNASSQPEYVLEGRFERNGEDRRVLLQLLSVADNAYVWSDSSEDADLDSLARSLNRAVITSSRPEGRAKQRCVKSHSFDHYVQGRYLWKMGTPDAIRNSISYFAKAAELDVSYAAAWAGYAEAAIVASLFGYSDPREAGAKIRDAAQKATALAEVLPEAHVAQGAVASLMDWDWEAGERALQRAIQLDGRDPKIHVAYAIQLGCRGLFNAALIEAERALDLDPGSLSINFVLGWLQVAAKRYDEAIAHQGMLARLAPDFPLAYMGLGWAHLGKGQYGDALAQFTNAINLMRGRSLLSGCLGHCYAKLNQRDEALRQLNQLIGHSSSQYSSPVSVAAIYTGMGQTDRALSALEQAADAHDCSLPLQLLNPEFDGLRGDSRFAAILDTIGLGKGRSKSAASE